jgi:hypothetical protein
LRYDVLYMCFSRQYIINKESKKFCVSGLWNLLVIFNANISRGCTVICKLNEMILTRFSESKFALNHIFIGLKTMFISFCNLVLFGLVISILVSSADTIGVALLTAIFGKSFM